MKCLYHNDLDGRCAGALVAMYLKEMGQKVNNSDFFEVDYVTKLPTEQIEDGEEVWFVDYSFKENTIDVLRDLVNRGCEVIWIDHHTSSINLREKYPDLKDIKGIVDNEYCGAYLTYLYIRDNYEINFSFSPFSAIELLVSSIEGYQKELTKTPITQEYKNFCESRICELTEWKD
jgi:oligoribonuclease NrnB/cAMP/cGMP phosphodiesterase (DHH superfamily)